MWPGGSKSANCRGRRGAVVGGGRRLRNLGEEVHKVLELDQRLHVPHHHVLEGTETEVIRAIGCWGSTLYHNPR